MSNALAEASLTQVQIAKLTDTSPSYVNQMMTGHKTPSAKWVNLVADTLKLQGEQRLKLYASAIKAAGWNLDLTKE